MIWIMHRPARWNGKVMNVLSGERPMTTATTPIHEAQLQAFLGKAVGDFGTAASAALVVMGDKLGLYRALAAAGPLSSAALAQRTGTVERYVREWLVNQAAAGFLEYDPDSGRYTLPPEHTLALTETKRLASARLMVASGLGGGRRDGPVGCVRLAIQQHSG
jgi:hypothetical protein